MIVGLDRLIANGKAGFVSGRYEIDGVTLCASNGTAHWLVLALRLGLPSKMTLITLRRAQPTPPACDDSLGRQAADT
jgi:hypothetical protein